MPLYVYENPETKETIEVLQGMEESHVYESNGVQWSRVFLSPQARVGSFSKVDPNSSRSFSNWIDKGKGGTLGDLWDASSELSQKRESIHGVDPVKRKSLDNYSKTRNGLKHPSELKK